MLIVTFSGVDGCGKSTQVELTAQWLAAHGLRVRKVAALRWSAAGIHASMRDRLKSWRKRRQAKGAPVAGVTSLPATGQRSAHIATPIRTYARGRSFDSDRRALSVRLRRLVIYPLDCLMLVACVVLHRLVGYDALVFDRYTFDKMVGLPNADCRLSRWLLRIAPRPDRSFFIDTPPEVARARRPEHTADYHACKSADYRVLAAAGIGLTALPPGTIAELQQRIRQDIASLLPAGSAVLSAAPQP